MIRGEEGDCGQEVRGEAERRGARSARSHGSRGQELGADPDESAHPAEGRRFGGWRRVERQRHLGSAGHQHQQCRSHASATGRGGVRGDAEPQVQPQLRPAADFRRGGGGETDRSGLLAGSGGVRPLEPASARRESRRIEHRRQGQRQHDRTDVKKNVAQTAPQSAMGDPARSQCGLRRRHGRRAGNLPEAARSRSSSRVFGRDLQAIDRRDARADPAPSPDNPRVTTTNTSATASPISS